jgi:hypothetical protein
VFFLVRGRKPPVQSLQTNARVVRQLSAYVHSLWKPQRSCWSRYLFIPVPLRRGVPDAGSPLAGRSAREAVTVTPPRLTSTQYAGLPLSCWRRPGKLSRRRPGPRHHLRERVEDGDLPVQVRDQAAR